MQMIFNAFNENERKYSKNVNHLNVFKLNEINNINLLQN